MVLMVKGEQARTKAGGDGMAGAMNAVRDQVGGAMKSMQQGKANVGELERVLSAIGGLALLGLALRRRNATSLLGGLTGAALLHRGTTGHCYVYDSLGLSTAEEEGMLVQQHGPAASLDAQKAVKVVHSVVIDRPRSELFRYWRQLDNLPRIMTHLESVEVIDERRSRWRAKAPAGQHVEWEAEIIKEVPDALIAWRSVDHATVPNAGSVRFTDAIGGGTELKISLDYQPPGGAVGVAIARLFGEEPHQQVQADLETFKETMEAGWGAGAELTQ
jgi:uncharacterized membrane protein